jgi:hypothetical protein
MQKYFERYPNDEQKAIVHYLTNIEVSESFYPVLSMFEVALRNSLKRELTEYFQSEDWYLCVGKTNGFRKLQDEINTATRHITSRNEVVTGPKVIAELTLGFWVRLLNAEYERVLWKPLRKAFPYLDKTSRQRRNVSAPINKIRNFRNRVFHHEPIAWNINELEKIYRELLLVMKWLNADLPQIAHSIDRVPEVLKIAREKLFENQ